MFAALARGPVRPDRAYSRLSRVSGMSLRRVDIEDGTTRVSREYPHVARAGPHATGPASLASAAAMASASVPTIDVLGQFVGFSP